MSNNSREERLVLVTGASGFIAKHTIDQLLKAGFRVRGTVRNDEEARIAWKALARNFDLPQLDQRFTLKFADLMVDDGWQEAVKDCCFVVHVASPYPLQNPRNYDSLVNVAKGGALRVIQAALSEPSVKRITMTSSIVAMMDRTDEPVIRITENSWTDTSWRRIPAYPLSKTLAERAVWDLAENLNAKNKIVTVNPAMVWGPMYDDVLSTSSKICKLWLTGAYPAVPKIAVPIVDVRDVAHLMVSILTTPNNVGGRRLITSADTLTFTEIGAILAEAFPEYSDKIPQRTLPNWLVWLLSLFDRNLQATALFLGTRYEADSKYVAELTGVTFRPASEAVRAMGQSLVDQHMHQDGN